MVEERVGGIVAEQVGQQRPVGLLELVEFEIVGTFELKRGHLEDGSVELACNSSKRLPHEKEFAGWEHRWIH